MRKQVCKPSQHHKGVSFNPMTYTKDNIEIVPYPSTARAENLTGQIFTRLTVLGFAGRDQWRVARWWCECECGNITWVAASGLRNSKHTSCGCLARELTSLRTTTHGQSQTSTFFVWCSMRQRCQNPTVPCYKNYGGRGIRVCDRWNESFENFIEDMGLKPSERYTVERRNTNGNYEPTNCYWGTWKEQNNNRRNNHLITYQGRTQTMAQWAEETGIAYKILSHRVYRQWPEHRLFSTPRRSPTKSL